MNVPTVDRALSCLNDLSSFIAFEKLEGLDSHQSTIYHDLAIGRVFAFVSAWQSEKLDEENDVNAAKLLLDLHKRGLQSIQVLGHWCKSGTADEEFPARAFISKP